jgi:hypothetical protein
MKNLIVLTKRTINVQWYIVTFLIVISIGCEKSHDIKTTNPSILMTPEEFPYELVGTIHNQFLSYLVYHNINPNNFDSIIISAQIFLETNYEEFAEDFYGLFTDDDILMEYIDLLSITESDLEQYISENADLEGFESDYIGIICTIILDDESSFSEKINIIEGLENDILSIVTDNADARWRLLSFVSVAKNSLLYWNQGAKVPTKNIVVADALGVYASSSAIATASMFGPWWGVAYAAVAAGTCSYIASRGN